MTDRELFLDEAVRRLVKAGRLAIASISNPWARKDLEAAINFARPEGGTAVHQIGVEQ